MDQKKSTDSDTKNEFDKGIWLLEKYGTYERNSWNEVPAEGLKMYLIFKNLCLTLVNNKTLIEHISITHENIRMIHRNDTLGIVITKDGVKMKKLRVKFAGIGLYSGVSMALNCVTMLKNYFKIEYAPTFSTDIKNPITDSKKSITSCSSISSNTITLPEHVSELLSTSNITHFYEDNKELNRLFPLEDIVEACILDTDFPAIVAGVHKILLEKMK